MFKVITTLISNEKKIFYNLMDYLHKSKTDNFLSLYSDQSKQLQKRLNLLTFYGETLLFITAKQGNLLAVTALLENQVNVDVIVEDGIMIERHNNGKTPLYIAAANGHLEVVKLLVYKGANINRVHYVGIDYDIQTALIAAILGKYTEVVTFLLKQGADKNTRNYSGRYTGTPFEIACQMNSIALVQLLSQGEFNVNQAIIEYYHFSRKNLFHRAISRGALQLTQFFVDNYVDINQMNRQGESPLLLAFKNKKHKIAEYLIDKGADVNQTCNGISPLYHAVTNNNLELVKKLIKHKAEVNQQSHRGVTALWLAAYYNHVKVAKYLVLHGQADLNIPNITGITPLAIVLKRHRNPELIEFLMLHGAKLPSSIKFGFNRYPQFKNYCNFLYRPVNEIALNDEKAMHDPKKIAPLRRLASQVIIDNEIDYSQSLQSGYTKRLLDEYRNTRILSVEPPTS